MKRHALALLLLVLCACGPAYSGGDGEGSSLSVDTLRGIGIDQHIGTSVPLDAPFVDETGARVVLGDYFAQRPVVLALMYNECPMMCSQLLYGLVASLKPLKETVGRDFDVVAVSIDPRETSASSQKGKAKYAERYGRAGAAGGFHFLTGDQASIDRIAKAVGFRYEYDEKTGQYAHASAITVVTPSGEIARYFFGSEFSPRDLRLSLVEATDGELGDVTDDLLLLCYQYDPVHGTYSAGAIGAVRLGGAATLLGLFAFWLWSWRRSVSGRSASRRRRRREAAA